MDRRFFVFAVLSYSCLGAPAPFGEMKRTETDRCTAIGAGPKAMKDGSVITTHNNDCQECDLRITHVPARDWPEGSKRPIIEIRDAYPRYVEAEGGIHGPDYVRSSTYPDATIFQWNASKPFAFIDQVPHTYAYTLGTYAIQNEKQVSIGESTCSSKFVARPKWAEGGGATFHMETLTEIALERCDTARCAINTIGELSVKHGFYGPAWDEDSTTAQDEAGEALIIGDPNEVWMFHLIPDDTGSSAIWVAQRVPDNHITVVANQFVIGEVVPDSPDFMYSDNIFSVAERNGFWDSSRGLLHFGRVYGNDRHKTAFACTRRVWRVFTLAAPSLNSILSPFTDGLATFGFGGDFSQPYPFSVAVDAPLSLQDIFTMKRDQFEGTLFDMTSGIDAGIFGDPMRYGPIPKVSDPVNGLEWDQYQSGVGFERPISLWRTAYSAVSQSRKNLPDEVGAVAWIAPYAPHHSSYVPVYAVAEKTPSSLNAGTQYKVDKLANWWVHCITGNYLSRWYKYTIEDVRVFQRKIEEKIFTSQEIAEKQAVSLILKQRALTPTDSSESNESEVQLQEHGTPVAQFLQRFHERTAADVRDDWWTFFFKMAGTYRDMYKVVRPHTENFSLSYKYLGVPRWFFESIGFWGEPGTPPPREQSPSPLRRYTFPSRNSLLEYRAEYPHGYNDTVNYANKQEEYAVWAQQFRGKNNTVFIALTSSIFGIGVGFWLATMHHRRNMQKIGYMPI